MAIDALIQAKRDGEELDYGPRIGLISDFVGKELQRFENYEVEDKTILPPVDKLSHLFIEALDEVWGTCE